MKNKQVTVSAMDKVFPYGKPKLLQSECTVFRNETFHFQVACMTDWLYLDTKVTVDSDIADCISVRFVEQMPARAALRKGEGDGYILKKKGDYCMYPDLLRPMYPEGENMRKATWSTFWVTVDGRKGLPVGEHKIKIRVYRSYLPVDNIVYDETSEFTLRVIDAELPEIDFTYTGWMHYDCISDQHNVKLFSEEFYQIFEKYLESAVSHYMTMLYTPIFTPSLDTAEGYYRKTAQLVKIEKKKQGYTFDFSDLEKFVDFVLARGIKKLELAHLATQHGANHCPKIMALVDGVETRIFGWDTDSTSEEYLTFLDAFMRAFSAFAKRKGIEDILYFHISDETGKEALPIFKTIKGVIDRYFENVKTVDALGHNEFYVAGVTTHPFIDVGGFSKCQYDWVYYSGGGRSNAHTPNRSFNMPSQRNRVLGALMYFNGNTGFLHWGFNFYNSTLSYRSINPFIDTDASGAFESGDTFLVYPAPDGVWESIRHEIFAKAFDDYRALKLLESLSSREEVLSFLKKRGVKAGYQYAYPTKERWMDKLRLAINKEIEKRLS